MDDDQRCRGDSSIKEHKIREKCQTDDAEKKRKRKREQETEREDGVIQKKILTEENKNVGVWTFKRGCRPLLCSLVSINLALSLSVSLSLCLSLSLSLSFLFLSVSRSLGL